MAEPAKFPGPTTQTLFADGVANFSHSTEFAKFYFFRMDPDFFGSGAVSGQIAAQVILPMTSLFQSVAFLNAAIEDICIKSPDLKAKWAEAQKFQKENFKTT